MERKWESKVMETKGARRVRREWSMVSGGAERSNEKEMGSVHWVWHQNILGDLEESSFSGQEGAEA